MDATLTIAPRARRAHAGHDVLGGQPRRLEVDGEEGIPLVGRHLRRVEVGVDAGVVDEDRDRAELTAAAGHQLGDLLLDADVAALEPAADADLGGRPLADVRIDVAEHHVGTLGDESLDRGPPDPTGATGHEHDVGLEAGHRHRSPLTTAATAALTG